MTIDELGIMLSAITKERFGEILNMKMPEDKSQEIGEQIADLSKRIDELKVEPNNTNTDDNTFTDKDVDDYFLSLAK